MKFPTNSKPETCISKDKHRGSLSEPYLDTEGATPMLVTIDGHRMTVLPVEADKTEQGWISPNAIKAARKLAGRKNNKAEIVCKDFLAVSDGTQFPRSTDQSVGFSRFPAWRQIVPDKNRPVGFQVALNAKFLAEIADALGSDEVILDFDTNMKPIRVLPYTASINDGRFGVLMVCKIK